MNGCRINTQASVTLLYNNSKYVRRYNDDCNYELSRNVWHLYEENHKILLSNIKENVNNMGVHIAFLDGNPIK